MYEGAIVLLFTVAFKRNIQYDIELRLVVSDAFSTYNETESNYLKISITTFNSARLTASLRLTLTTHLDRLVQ